MITYPKLCSTCRLELLPHENDYGAIVVSEDYCDKKCEDIGKKYPKIFTYQHILDTVVRTEYGIIQRVHYNS